MNSQTELPPDAQSKADEAQKQAQKYVENTSGAANVHTFDENMTPQQKREQIEKKIPTEVLPPQKESLKEPGGMATDVGTVDAEQIRLTAASAEKKPTEDVTTTGVKQQVKSEPGAFTKIPNYYRSGWTAFSNLQNPGGSIELRAAEKPEDAFGDQLKEGWYGEWWQNAGVLIFTGFFTWLLMKMGAGLATVLVVCAFLGTYYQTSVRRFRRNVRDDIQRELIKNDMAAGFESMDWLNTFLEKFWLIFEPVLCAQVIEQVDTVLADNCPAFLDSLRLTTFTLGTKPPRIDAVQTYRNTESDIVTMDWKVSFTPTDVYDMTPREQETKVNPKIILTIRVGKGVLGAGMPVLVEDISFKGYMRVKVKLMSKFPHAKRVELCFMEKPEFDYVLKPVGGETFGFDINNIPGLQGFIRDQVHNNLGPMMYYPNVFTLDVEKLMSGDMDMTSANGVLAVTVYSASKIKSGDLFGGGSIDPYVRFRINRGPDLGRTSVLTNTDEPNWNETHFLLLNNLNDSLSMDLCGKNNTTRDRDFGSVVYALQKLADSEDASDEGANLQVLRHGKPMSELKVDLRYLPVSKPTKEDDGSIVPAVESNSGILRFTIHEVKGLSGKPSPYARVLVNGTEKIKTKPMKKKANPKFEKFVEVLVIDKTEVQMRVQIQDATSFSTDYELGSWSSSLLTIFDKIEQNEGWWDLTRNGKNCGRLRISAEWKPVVMTGLAESLGGHGYYSPPIGIVRLLLWEAKDLKNVESVGGGKSDPYVRIKSGVQIRACTEVVDNNLNPEWGAVVYVPIHSDKEDLTLEVMDWNANSKDKSLGMADLSVKELVKMCAEGEGDTLQKWYESTGVRIDKWAPLKSLDRTQVKGQIKFEAEFYPTLALAKDASIKDKENAVKEKAEAMATEAETRGEVSDVQAETDKMVAEIDAECPEKDLHGTYIKYTPDDIVDLRSYESGVLTVKIHEIAFNKPTFAYAEVLIDSIQSQYRTTKLRGSNLEFNETTDAFVKESDFSKVAIQIKPGSADEKDDDVMAYWVGQANDIIRQIQWRNRTLRDEGKGTNTVDDGQWFPLFGGDNVSGKIRLSFKFSPVIDFTLDPKESLENQGNLTVTLISAQSLMAADKSGKSDPYVVFSIDGNKVYKSATVKKNLNPKWKNESFTAPVLSRFASSFRLEVFDWNQVGSGSPLGSSGISLSRLESFTAQEIDLPLEGVKGVTGSVRIRILWQPQLLARKKQHTSILSSGAKVLTGTAGATMGAGMAVIGGGAAIAGEGLQLGGKVVGGGLNVGTKVIGGGLNVGSKVVGGGGKAIGGGLSSVFGMVRKSSKQDVKSEADDGNQSGSMTVPESGVIPNSQSTSTSTMNGQNKRNSMDPRGDLTETTGANGTVEVHVVSARGLKGVDKSGTSDPFVRLKVGKDHSKTKHIKKSLDPQWNETFKFKVTEAPVGLELDVKDHNTLSSSVALGSFHANLWDILKVQPGQSAEAQQWFPISPPGSGEIQIKLVFSP